MKTIKETLHLARILTLAAASCFAFWACAPMMSTPPATPMDPQAAPEYGHGVWGGALLHSERPTPLPLGGYQYYRRAPIGESGRNESGIMMGVGLPSALTFGGLYRLGLIKSETGYLGLQGAGGLVWLHGSLPAAVKIAEGTWLTTQPSYSWGLVKAVRLPIGMSIERKKFGRLDAEFGVRHSRCAGQPADRERHRTVYWDWLRKGLQHCVHQLVVDGLTALALSPHLGPCTPPSFRSAHCLFRATRYSSLCHLWSPGESGEQSSHDSDIGHGRATSGCGWVQCLGASSGPSWACSCSSPRCASSVCCH